MYLSALAICAALLAIDLPLTTAKESFLNLPAHRHVDLADTVRREAHDILDSHIFHRRSAAPNPSASASASTAAVASGTASDFSTPTWNATATSSCTTALAALTGNITNPAGMAVCYNIAFLDNTTGVFEADLRLYQAAAPSGPFTGIQPSDISVGLSYLHAVVSSSSSSTSTKRAVSAISDLEPRQQPNTTMTMLQTFQFVGQIDKTLKLTSLNSSALQSLLIPTITLSSSTPSSSSTPITAPLPSTDTAYFTTGVFANQGRRSSSTPITNINPTAAAAQASKFVLPGVTLGIFPVGLVITGSWAALFLGVVGWGTWGRVQFREHYRRRVRRDEWVRGKL